MELNQVKGFLASQCAEHITIHFTNQGTVAILQNQAGDVISVGIAVLNPKDVPDPLIGGLFALSRAYGSKAASLSRMAHEALDGDL